MSSSRVRELIYFEGDISSYVPQAVVKKVEADRDPLFETVKGGADGA